MKSPLNIFLSNLLTFLCFFSYSFIFSHLFAADNDLYKLEFSKPEFITISTRDDFKIVGNPAKKEFVAPLPPNNDYQILNSFSCNKESLNIKEVSEYNRNVLSGTFATTNKIDSVQKNQLFMTYVMQFTRRKLVSWNESQDVKTLDDKALYLQSDDTLDWKSPDFRKWLQKNNLYKDKGESVFAFCNRIFKMLCDNGKYIYPPQCLWKASDIIKRRSIDIVGDCGVFSVLFVSICRANEIPARMLSGRWVADLKASKGLDARSVKTHVYLEFFDSSVGWIPVDVASALLFGSPSDPFQFFGSDPKTPFLILHFDSDLKFRFRDNQLRETQWLLFPYLHEMGSKWLVPGETHFMESSL
jgi:transglutaminase-like putative cysteine protease